MPVSHQKLAAKGFTEDEIAHISHIFRRARTPVHLLWLPIVVLAQTFVMLRLLPLLSMTAHASAMIATVLLCFALSWIFMEIAPHLARGKSALVLIFLSLLWSVWFGLLLASTAMPSAIVWGRGLAWFASWTFPLLLHRYWSAG